MLVENKSMYHVHTTNKYDSLWQVGKEIDNCSRDFQNNFYQITQLFRPVINLNEEEVLLASLLRCELENSESLNSDKIRRLLKWAKTCLQEYQLLVREQVLEEVRKEYYEDLPSRRSSIWLCEKDQLAYWLNNLKEDRKVFLVSATGNLWQANAQKLPELGSDIIDTKSQAHRYWQNKQGVSCEYSEYLFQGKLQILKEVDLKQMRLLYPK